MYIVCSLNVCANLKVQKLKIHGKDKCNGIAREVHILFIEKDNVVNKMNTFVN